jgi:uncharacterized SAM-binding protein YcdF (DUF218 family)
MNIIARKNFAIVVLGVSPIDCESISPQMITRVNAALLLLKKHPNAVCILTGGSNGACDLSEAELMKRILLSNNINQKVIILEEEARNTLENVLFSTRKIRKLNTDFDVIICTEKYHAYRTKILFLLLDMNVHNDYLPSMTKTMTVCRKIWLLFREPLAIVKDVSLMTWLNFTVKVSKKEF